MTATLTDISAAIVDCEHRTAPAGDGYALSVGTKAMKDGRLILGSCKPISDETYGLWTRRLVPVEGDLILAREAPVGDVVRVPKGLRVCLGQRTVLIRPDPDRVDPRFLHYWLLGPIAQTDMHSRAAGATVPHLNVEDIRVLDVTALPDDRRLQSQAAMILGAIDDLIENNLRRIALLEQMAQAIYREWFVHFRYPGHEGDELVDSRLGPIPAQWKVAPLDDVATLERHNVRPSERPDVYFEHFSIPNFDAGRLATWDPGESIKSGKYLVRLPSVLVSKLNPRIPRIWLARPSTSDHSVASTEFLMLCPKSGWSLEFLYLVTSSGPFKEQVTSLAGGTSNSHQRARPQDFMALPVLAIPDTLLQCVRERIEPMIRMSETLRLEAAQAKLSRDMLLPRLVTGAIDVSQLDLDALLDKPAA